MSGAIAKAKRLCVAAIVNIGIALGLLAIVILDCGAVLSILGNLTQ